MACDALCRGFDTYLECPRGILGQLDFGPKSPWFRLINRLGRAPLFEMLQMNHFCMNLEKKIFTQIVIISFIPQRCCDETFFDDHILWCLGYLFLLPSRGLLYFDHKISTYLLSILYILFSNSSSFLNKYSIFNI